MDFNEKDYLKMYQDVQEAVNLGFFASGLEHYEKHGKKEGRKPCKPIDSSRCLEYSTKKNIHETPDQFRKASSIIYPIGNNVPFERYYYEFINNYNLFSYRTYLPIFWTEYYLRANYGGNKDMVSELQRFIDKLPKEKKYYTIVQYDDGILNDISGLDIIVYSMGCKKPGYYPIPLLSEKENTREATHPVKDIKYSFNGADTHKIRKALVNTIKSKDVTFEKVDYDRYTDILKRSIFALCPRGYGIASFRMFEAMSYSCIPVYISDEFWEPFNIPFETYGVKITENQIPDLDKILDTVDVDDMVRRGNDVYNRFFIYSMCAMEIVKTLS